MGAESRLKVGMENTIERTVTPDWTAAALGNTGVEVLATPWLVSAAEGACVGVIMPYLETGEASVGTHVELSHLAATPVGKKFRITATITAIEGRKVTFRFEGHDETNKITEGSHTRVIVNLERLMERTRKK